MHWDGENEEHIQFDDSRTRRDVISHLRKGEMSVVAARNLKRVEANLVILPETPSAERTELTQDAEI